MTTKDNKFDSSALADPGAADFTAVDLSKELNREYLSDKCAELTWLKSVKTTQFNTLLAQNDIDHESLAAALDISKIRIKALQIICDQNLDFEIWLWRNDPTGGLVANLIEFQPLYASDAVQIAGAGDYYYVLTGLDIPYEDLSEAGTIWISLVNRSAASKTATDTTTVAVGVGVK